MTAATAERAETLEWLVRLVDGSRIHIAGRRLDDPKPCTLAFEHTDNDDTVTFQPGEWASCVGMPAPDAYRTAELTRMYLRGECSYLALARPGHWVAHGIPWDGR